MGKRKRKYEDSNLRKKIRRLEKKLLHLSSDSSDEYEYEDDAQSSPDRCSTPSSDRMNLYSESEGFLDDGRELEGPTGTQVTPPNNTTTVVALPTPPTAEKTPESANNAPAGSVPGTSTEIECLPVEILEALGDPKGKDEVFGPKIPDEISKRWGRVLVDGMNKDQKKELMEKTLVPDNFRLIKAPLLNPEITPVLSDSVKNRDKLLEKAQNHLGLGIAGLTNLTSSLIQADMDKIEIIKRISEVSQIFLDLHHENTNTRRKLVITSLDKRFTSMITEVKRDNYLFGVNLGEKIKASKTAEKSGLQIKRSNGAVAGSRKYPQQGNWRGPPRNQGHKVHKQGGPKSRYANHSNRRPPPSSASSRPSTSKTSTGTRKTS